MNIIIYSIREGAGEIGQIDISQIHQEQYPIFAAALNNIADAQLVPMVHPMNKRHFPDNHFIRMYFSPMQEQQIVQLLQQYAPAKRNFSKTFFVRCRKTQEVAC
jgi:hypothetical protein